MQYILHIRDDIAGRNPVSATGSNWQTALLEHLIATSETGAVQNRSANKEVVFQDSLLKIILDTLDEKVDQILDLRE